MNGKGSGVVKMKRRTEPPSRKAKKQKRPRGTKFINYTCKLDKDNCIDKKGLCIHNTPTGNSKVGCLVNAEDAQLSCGSQETVEFKCDVCLHVFSPLLKNVTSGKWCSMCSRQWKHCGVDTCTFCFDRSFASYKGVTLNNKKKVDCIVNRADLRLPLGTTKTVEFKCDVCLHVFSPLLYNVNKGQWCSMCSCQWKHCGVETCTFCFDRSFASYKDVTLNNKKKVDCIVNRAYLRLPPCTTKTVEFKCDVCLHVFSTRLDDVTSGGSWCSMCSSKWKHCGDTCTFCFDRSFASYEGVTLNNKKKVDCIVNRVDLRLPLGTTKTVEFNCDVCLHVFSTSLNSVTTNGQWCGKCKNKTELMVLNYLQEMKIDVDTQYIPGGEKMEQNYGKFGKMDYYLRTFNILWELDGVQHYSEVKYFGGTLFHRMILDKWKEFWARKCGMKVIRFDQEAIWNKKYDWKQEMKNLLTFSGKQLTNQQKVTKNRYKMYAKQHGKKSKRVIPNMVKESHKKAYINMGL